MNKTGLKFLIAGVGSIGRRHLENLLALGQDEIILYRTGKGALGNVEQDFSVFDDLNTAIAQKPDAVIISNPTALHMAVAEAAASSNVDIFLEKPISHTYDSLQRFEAVMEASQSQVFVAYQFRFNAGLQKVKDILESGSLGKPVSFISRWGEYLPDWHPWEDYRNSYAARSEMGGGVVLTLSHPIDYLRWFFGDAARLTAETGNRSNLELACEDFADIHLVFRSGVEGDLHLDYDTQPKVHDLQIHCETGDVFWDYDSNIVKVSTAIGATEEILPPAGYERNHMYLDEMAHFIAVCKREEKPICTYHDGKQALNIALGILQSGRYHDQVIFED
jgi:predicted dehydrogenase